MARPKYYYYISNWVHQEMNTMYPKIVKEDDGKIVAIDIIRHYVHHLADGCLA